MLLSAIIWLKCYAITTIIFALKYAQRLLKRSNPLREIYFQIKIEPLLMHMSTFSQ